MQSKLVRIHDFPAFAEADLGNLTLIHEMPKNWAYISLILQCVAVITTTVVAAVAAEDRQHRMLDRFQLKRDGGTPIDITGRDFGHFVQYLHGVEDDVQETAPLVIGANVLEHMLEIPLCDPSVPFASPQFVETLLVAWRRKNLEVRMRVPNAIGELYTAAGGTVVLTSMHYSIFARVLKDPTTLEVEMMGGLDKEMRYASKPEITTAAVTRPYGSFRNEHLDRDIRFMKLGLMTTDAKVRTPDTLEECTIKIGGEFYFPENCDADLVKAINVWDRQVDLPDGVYVINLDQNHDHVTAPFASEGAECKLWRTLAAATGEGILDSLQMSVGEAEYPSGG